MDKDLPQAGFEALCRDLCGLAGISVPVLVPDENGAAMLAVELHRVRVVLSRQADQMPGQLLLEVVMGALPIVPELESCRTLMNINAHVLAYGCTLGRDPESGDVVLAQVLDAMGPKKTDFRQRIGRLVGVAHEWRDHHFLNESRLGLLDEALRV